MARLAWLAWLAGLVLSLLQALPATAAWPYLVSDLNQISAGSDIRFLGRTGDRYVFAADDGVHGREVWAYTEGSGEGPPSTEGALLLKDINPGPASSRPIRGGEGVDLVFFITSDPLHGYEHWLTDGTPGGTRLLRELWENASGSNVAPAAPLCDLYYFSADDGIHGAELWGTDGSRSGTWMAADIRPGPEGSSPHVKLTALGRVFFTADDGTHGRELWQFHCATGAVALVADMTPGARDSFHYNLTVAGDQLFLTVGDALWRTDGTEEGTTLVKDRGTAGWFSLSKFVAAGSTVYFRAGDHLHGYELWSSDGTPEGTDVFRDLYPGTQSSNVAPGIALGEDLIFVATDPVHGTQIRSTADPLGDDLLVRRFDGGVSTGGPLMKLGDEVLFWLAYDYERRLWKTDGTPEGTNQVWDFGQFGGGNYLTLYWRAELGGFLYFFPFERQFGRELWRTDGTTAGTGLVKEIVPGVNEHWELPGRLHLLGDLLLLVADDGLHGDELWRSDGTADGTWLAADVNKVSDGSDPRLLTVLEGSLPVPNSQKPTARVGDRLYFAAESTDGPGLWRTGGSYASTFEVLRPRREVIDLAVLGDELLVAADYLYKSDGTEAGTAELRDAGGSRVSKPAGFAELGGKVFFHSWRHPHGRELWRTDGTEAGTFLVKDISPGSWSSMDQFTRLVSAGGLIYFVADDGEHGPELWRSDGTAAGTRLVKEIHPTPNSSCASFSPCPQALTPVGDTLFFVADDDAHGRELWRSDGSEAGTYMVQDIYEGPRSSYPEALTAVGDTLFLKADSPEIGGALWKASPSTGGAALVRDIYPGYAPPDILAYPYLRDFTALDGNLYFSANDLVHGHELWTSDGTAEGTRLVSDIVPGAGSSWARGLRAVGEIIYFSAIGPGDHGLEAWRSDGTGAGTWEVADIRPGEGSSEPSDFTPLNDLVLFSADDGLHGRELWALPAAPRPCVAGTRLELERRQVNNAEAFRTCGTIQAGPSLHVLAGGDLELIAGEGIELRNGLRIDSGGILRATINRTGAN